MPQPERPPSPHTWAVTRQEEEPSINDNGLPTTLHHVHFKTNVGHESHVTLPDEHFSAENVAAQIHHKVTELLKVHHMNSSNMPPAP